MTKKTKQIISVILAGTIVTSFALSSLQIAKGESLTQTYSDSTNTTNEYINQEITNSSNDLYNSNSSNENQIDEYLQQVNPTADDISLNPSIDTLSVDENTEEQILDDTYEVPVETNSFRYQNGHNIHPSETNTSSRTARSTDAVTLRHGENPQRPDGKMPTAHAIDISNYQGDVDWNQVKNSGKADFVILRLGTGWTIHQEGANWVCDTSKGDKRFKEYAASCEKLGIPIGGYFFSYADSVEDAKKEAQLALEMLKGVKVDYPIYYDLEDMSTTGTQSPATIAEMAKVFNDTLSAAGYQVGVYANKSWFTSTLNHPYFKTQRQWLAQYNTNSTYNAQYEMWQYTSKGSVPGIYGNVDLNYWYGDLPSNKPGNKPSINAFVNSKEDNITVTVTNLSNAKSVALPTWTKTNEQDDIKWFSGKKIGLNTWSLSIPISQFNNARDHYITQYYYYDMNNVSHYLGMTSSQIGTISISSITTNIIDANSGKFTVTLNGVQSKYPLSSIAVPIWSDINGQDDIVWYSAINQGSGKYSVTVDPKNHKYDSGNYTIYVYGINNIATSLFLGAKNHSVTFKHNPTVTSSVDSAHKNIIVTANGLYSAKSVALPTWSDYNGQDDIGWYSGIYKGNGTWTVTIPISNHNNQTGSYTTQAYYYDYYGNSNYFGSITTDISYISIKDITTSVLDQNSGKFKVTIQGVSSIVPVNTIAVPIWSDINGQDDIGWYTAQNDGNGNYSVIVDPKNHKNDKGTYTINVYGTDNRNISFFLGAKSHLVSFDDNPTVTSSVDSAHKNITVTVNGLYSAKSVALPTWSNYNGQDDIGWYSGIYKGNGTWTVTVPISNHNNQTGTYTTQAYYYDYYGNSNYFGTTTADISYISIKNITTSVLDQNSGKFKVTIQGVSSIVPVNTIAVPIWSDINGQDDIGWYTAQNDGNGNYSVIVDPKNHKNDKGTYTINVYGTDNRNISFFLGAKSHLVSFKDNPTVTSSVDSAHKNITVTVSGLYTAKSVALPTWSDYNGQDDISWYSGVYKGDGIWSVTIPISNHNNQKGSYTTQAYFYDYYGNSNYFGSSTVIVN